jgi:hypothetical protein
MSGVRILGPLIPAALALAVLTVAGCTGPSATAPIDQSRAGQIARDYFATAHGTGVKLMDVRETDKGITNDTACGAKWEVLMEGTVTETSGVSYGSSMYLCVDPTTGAVTRGPAG